MPMIKRIVAELFYGDESMYLSAREKNVLHEEYVEILSRFVCEPDWLYPYNIAKQLVRLERLARMIGHRHIYPLERLDSQRICHIVGMHDVVRPSSIGEWMDSGGDEWRRYCSSEVNARVERGLLLARATIVEGGYNFDPNKQLAKYIWPNQS